MAAQVIGTSGSDQSRLLILDKGAQDGLKAGMPVIAWTARKPEQWEAVKAHCDNLIFEGWRA